MDHARILQVANTNIETENKEYFCSNKKPDAYMHTITTSTMHVKLKVALIYHFKRHRCSEAQLNSVEKNCEAHKHGVLYHVGPCWAPTETGAGNAGEVRPGLKCD